jgi:hypothetical protein
MAERVGFEPTVLLQVRRISSAVLSTTQPPLQVAATFVGLSEGAEPIGGPAKPQASTAATQTP